MTIKFADYFHMHIKCIWPKVVRFERCKKCVFVALLRMAVCILKAHVQREIIVYESNKLKEIINK